MQILFQRFVIDNTELTAALSIQSDTAAATEPCGTVIEQRKGSAIQQMPVKDHQTQQLIGIVALGDVATKHSAQVDRTLVEISTPSEPDRPPLDS